MPIQADSLPRVTNHPSQQEVKCWICYIDSLGKFNYGSVTRMFQLHETGKKWVRTMKITDKQFYSCFMTVASFKTVLQSLINI